MDRQMHVELFARVERIIQRINNILHVNEMKFKTIAQNILLNKLAPGRTTQQIISRNARVNFLKRNVKRMPERFQISNFSELLLMVETLIL